MLKVIKICPVSYQHEIYGWTDMTESEVLIKVIMKSKIFWDVIPCHCHENLKSNTVILYGEATSLVHFHHTIYHIPEDSILQIAKTSLLCLLFIHNVQRTHKSEKWFLSIFWIYVQVPVNVKFPLSTLIFLCASICIMEYIFPNFSWNIYSKSIICAQLIFSNYSQKQSRACCLVIMSWYEQTFGLFSSSTSTRDSLFKLNSEFTLFQ
jgi:hypothetical protein